MAVYRHGRWKWIEKGDEAVLVIDDTRIVWRGSLQDPRRITPSEDAPLEVLLELSLQRLDTA